MNSNYCDIDQFQTLKRHEKNKSLSLFHINACSLSKNFDDLEHLLKCTNKVFDIVAVSQTRITRNTSLTSNINVQNYFFEFTQTESNAEGTPLYIANHLSYKPRTDLGLNKSNQLESTFTEIINSRKGNTIVGCLYKHPNMDLADFNKNYLNTLVLRRFINAKDSQTIETFHRQYKDHRNMLSTLFLKNQIITTDILEPI